MKYNDFKEAMHNALLSYGSVKRDPAPVLISAQTEVVVTAVLRGEPGGGENRYRAVIQIWSKEGEFIAEHDPLADEFVQAGEAVRVHGG